MPEWLAAAELPWLYSVMGLFLVALLAASLLPLGSEWLLLWLLHDGGDPALLWLVASAGNIAGSLINYALGYWLGERLAQRQQGSGWQRAQVFFQRYGVWSLLLAWVPVIGDPLTLLAGIMRVRLALFIVLVAVGKCARYGVLVLPWL